MIKIFFLINSIIFGFIFFVKFENKFDVYIYNFNNNFYLNETIFYSFNFNLNKFLNNLTNIIILNKFKEKININETNFNIYHLNNLPLKSKIIIKFNNCNNYFNITCKIIAPIILLKYFSNQTYNFINNLAPF